MAAQNEKAASVDNADQDWEELRQEFEARKREILRAPGVEVGLDALKRAGADADRVLSGIALVASDHSETLKAALKSSQRRLSDMAKKLEQVSTEAANTLSSPLSSSGFFKWILIPGLPEDWSSAEEQKHLSDSAIMRVKPIVKLLRAEAKQFGTLHKNHDRIRTVVFMGGLLAYVKESTGEFHDECMADLLQAAHDELGLKAKFSAPVLRKLRQRALPYLIRKRKANSDLDQLYGTLGD
jgi:ParB-like chromosome segregation protein Spo0J